MEPNVKLNKTAPAKHAGEVLAVKVLKTYQPVQFNKNLDKHFTADRPGMDGLVITFDTKRQIIFISQPGKDNKIVVPANVEFMELAE